MLEQLLRKLMVPVPTSPEGRLFAGAYGFILVLVLVVRVIAFRGGGEADATTLGPHPSFVLPVWAGGLPAPTDTSSAGTIAVPARPQPPRIADGSTLALTSPPERVIIPAIGVDSGLLRLGLNPDHTLSVPTTYKEAGWYQGSAIPGQQGPAVIVGHVDSHAGPAVFYGLRTLVPGDLIWIVRADSSRIRFVVTRLVQYPKAAFPTRLVYGATPRATLRLITCGGQFNHATGHYLDNIIAFANLG
jgi:hypothetical protein